MKRIPPILPTHQLDVLPVIVSTQCLRAKTQSHIHHHTQLCYVRSGVLRHTIGGKLYIQEPDSCSVLLPYTEHMIDLTQSPDTPVVTFISFFDNFLTENGYHFFPFCNELACFENHSIPRICTFENSDAKKARSLVLRMVNEFSKNTCADFALIAALTGELFSLMCSVDSAPHGNATISNRIVRIKAAMEYIDSNYEKKLTIEDLCPISGMSRSTFTSNFKAITGLTFSQYLLSRRLAAVRALLLKQHRSKILLDNVAKRCGLGERTNLTRTFTKHFGISPSKFCMSHFNTPNL